MCRQQPMVDARLVFWRMMLTIDASLLVDGYCKVRLSFLVSCLWGRGRHTRAALPEPAWHLVRLGMILLSHLVQLTIIYRLVKDGTWSTTLMTSSQFLFARGEANLPSPRLTLSFLPHRLWSKVAARLGARLTFLSYRWAGPRMMNGLFPGPPVTSRAHAIVHRSGGGDQLWRYAGTGMIRVFLSSM